MLKIFGSKNGFTLIQIMVALPIVMVALVGVLQVSRSGIVDPAKLAMRYKANALAQMYLTEILSRRFDENTVNIETLPAGVAPYSETSCLLMKEEDLGTAKVSVIVENDCSQVSGATESAVYPVDQSPSVPPDPELRSEFDDVDDYDGLVEGTGCSATPILDSRANDRDVAPDRDYHNFCVRVEVGYDGDYNGIMNDKQDTPPKCIDPAGGAGGEVLCSGGPTDIYEVTAKEREQTAKLIRVTVTDPDGTTGAPFAAYRGGY